MVSCRVAVDTFFVIIDGMVQYITGQEHCSSYAVDLWKGIRPHEPS